MNFFTKIKNVKKIGNVVNKVLRREEQNNQHTKLPPMEIDLFLLWCLSDWADFVFVCVLIDFRTSDMMKLKSMEHDYMGERQPAGGKFRAVGIGVVARSANA